jgi:hypothetical protein
MSAIAPAANLPLRTVLAPPARHAIDWVIAMVVLFGA